MLAPVIHLEPLTYEELLVLIEKLADIHAGYFGYGRTLTEAQLVGFLKAEFGAWAPTPTSRRARSSVTS